MTAPLEFWFEFASTYSYPAAMRVGALCATAGVPLRWRPFLLGPLFAAQGWRDSPFNLYPAKGAYMWRDLARVCAAEGLPLRRPSAFPRGSLLAARLACCADGEPWLPAFVRAVYHANFAADRDIADAAVVANLLSGLGLPAAAWLARAGGDDAKQRLRAQTEAAAARGLFGAPAGVVGGEIFWGNDRLEAAVAAARGTAVDAAASGAVLDAWFGPPDQDAAALAARQGRWFGSAPEVDAELRRRFGALVCAAARGQLAGWAATPRGRLALVLLLDQLPRNVYRGQPEAFASDAQALPLALTALDAGLDAGLDILERSFLYMPLEHAEDLALQERGVAVFARLLDESPPALRRQAQEFLDFARQHRDVIARFGRFPHRNAVLGRPSTPQEVAYLADGGHRFGQ